MNVKRGGIYVLSKEWQPFEQPIVNHLPIIVIGYNKKEQYVYAVQIGIKSARSKIKSLIFIEFYIDRQKRISCISCDAVYKIPTEYIEYFMGYVDYEIVNEIKMKSNYFHDESFNTEKWDTQTEFGIMNLNYTIISNVKMINNYYGDYKSNNININSNNNINGSGNTIGKNNKIFSKELTDEDFDFINKLLLNDPIFMEDFSDVSYPDERCIAVRTFCIKILILVLIFVILFFVYYLFIMLFDVDISKYLKKFFDVMIEN